MRRCVVGLPRGVDDGRSEANVQIARSLARLELQPRVEPSRPPRDVLHRVTIHVVRHLLLVTIHLPESWHREHEWTSLFQASHWATRRSGLTRPRPGPRDPTAPVATRPVRRQ
jgi:hypothetical protein